MRSDPPGRRAPLARLADVLASAADGARPTSIELAELVWLAGQMAPPSGAETPQASPGNDTPPAGPASPPRESGPPPTGAPAEERVPLRLPADRPETAASDAAKSGAAPEAEPPGATAGAPDDRGTRPRHAPVHVPVPPMVTHPLTLQRALRPLKRRVPSPVGQVIDEEATAHRIARLGAHPRGWLPVLRPAEERWLRLSLVHDAGPTMPIWRPLVHELHTALAQSGIFRTVELHRAEPDGTVPPQAAHAPATGRTVTLLISDCMGPQWRQGAAGTRWYRTLRRWAAHMPLAVIQPLPERLWRTTALPTTPGSLSAPHPAAPSGALTFTPYAYADDVPPGDAGPAANPTPVPIPVLEPSGTWLSHWASLVAGSGGAQLPGAVGWLGTAPPPPDGEAAEDVTRLSPEELVLRFRSTASPEAFRLAGHLAVGEPRLPLMRLVQAAVEERPRPQHLAEVILSGMLTGAAQAAPGAYEFRDGVRELLLRTLPRTARGRTRELLARVGGLIDERAGVAPGELHAVASVPGRGGGLDAPVGEPFATVAPESALQLGAGRGRGGELLGDRYRLLEQIGHSGRVWLAEDVRQDGEHVVVKRYPEAPQWLRLGFTRTARQLSRFPHANVAAVRDYANGEVPYLVMEFVEGGNLDELRSRYPGGLGTGYRVDLITQLARAVFALHNAGLAHGALAPAQVRLPERGPVLCGFALVPYDDRSRSADLRALGSLVELMTPEAVGIISPRATFWGTLNLALKDLDSDDPARQSHGLRRLTQLAPPTAERAYSLLGPLRVTQDGRRLATGSSREQAMLVMLLLGRGRGVTRDELTDGLWDAGTAPADAHRLLGTYASRLRNALGPASVVTEGDTYTLALPTGPDVVDLFHCQRLAADAQDAVFAGDGARAGELVRTALDLWRGTPLEGVPGPAARATRANIENLRQTLLRTRQELGQELVAAAQEAAEPPELPELPKLPDTFAPIEDEVLAPHEEDPGTQLHDLGVRREAVDDQPVGPPTTLTFEYVARPAGRKEDTRQDLGREISHLLIRGGIGPDQFEMRPGPRGWEVTVAPDVHVLHVLTATVSELPAALDVFPVLGLGVTLTHEPDPTVSAPTVPSGLRHLLGGNGKRAVVIVSNDLHERLNRPSRLFRQRFQPVPQSDDWYCEVTTDPPSTPVPGAIESVILGFDGTLARLYSDQSARHASRALTALVAERRDPEDALSGTPLLPEGRPAGSTAHRVHPMDVLRAFAGHRGLSGELHTRLEEIELQAALTAKPLPRVASLLHGLARREETVRLAIVTDTSPRAVTAYLGAKGLHLPRAGIHGRTPDLTLLMPDPDCPRRALEQLGTPADRCVMVGSSPEEAAAAQSLRIAFIGYAPNREAGERFAAAGVRTTMSDLSQLADLLRAR